MSKPLPKPQPKLTTGEVAALFGVQPHTVRRWVEAERIEVIRTPGGSYRFDAAYIHAMLDGAADS